MDTTSNPVAKFFGDALSGIKTKLLDTAAALQDGTASAAGAADVATKAVKSAPNAFAAAEDIGKLIVEVETHDWADIPATAADFATRSDAILQGFGVKLPLLTQATSILVKWTGK